MPHKDKEKRQAYAREYRSDHSEEIRNRQHKWYIEHRSELKIRHQKYRENHRAEAKARSKKWSAEHPTKIRNRWIKWYEKNREKRKAYSKKYHSEHLLEDNAKRRKYTSEHQTERSAYGKQYRSNNIIQVKNTIEKWKSNNPEKVRAINSSRRARKRGVIGSFSAKEWRDMLNRYDYHCAYCNQKFDKLTQDHVVPLIKHGKHDAGNIVPACIKCNLRKGTKDVIDFLKENSILST